VSSRLLDPRTNLKGRVTGGDDKQPPKKKVRVVTAAQDSAARSLKGLYERIKTKYPLQAIQDVLGNAVAPLGSVHAGVNWASADEIVKGVCKQVQEKWDGEGEYSGSAYANHLAVPWMRREIDELLLMQEADVGMNLHDMWVQWRGIKPEVKEEFKGVIEADMTNFRAMLEALNKLMDTDVLLVDAPV
jgi:hypothetical protein